MLKKKRPALLTLLKGKSRYGGGSTGWTLKSIWNGVLNGLLNTGLRRPMKSEPKVLENDALVVLCLRDVNDTMTHHEFKVRASARGIALTRSQCHNMLHRAIGRVGYWTVDGQHQWRLTSAGYEYRMEVTNTFARMLAMESRT